MKVCVITTVHPPDDVRINKELKTLAKAGYEVFYIAPEGNFETSSVKYIPIIKYKSRIKRLIKGSKEAFKQAININADIYHFHDPELINLGLKLKKRGKKVIYDIHEDYPSVIMMKSWLPKWSRFVISKFFKKYQARAVEKFDGIIVTVKECLSNLDKYNELSVVPNYPEIDFLQSLAKNKKMGSKIRFLYVGSIDTDRSIKEIIDAFIILKQRNWNVELELIGPVYDKNIKNKIEQTKNEFSDFYFSERIPYKEAMKRTSEADVGLLIVHRGKSKEESSPLKLFEYMALGLPQISSNFIAWRKILDKGPCALYVEPENINDIAEKMEKFCKNPQLIQQLGSNSLRIVQKYSWKSIEDRLINMYERLEQKK